MTNANPNRNPNAAINLADHALVLVIVCLIALISNWTGTGTGPITALPGMLIIYGMVFAGLVLAKLMPFYLPSVAWISLISVGMTMPAFPASEWLLGYLKEISFLSLVSPVLAYAGLAISKLEIETFKRSGVKILLIALLVFTGTFVGSAFIADLML
ncbi:hypothetical protein K6T12_10380 [Marinobacterium sp. CAU 1594]|nr:hypothetical protein [Marinobacterium arenosum]